MLNSDLVIARTVRQVNLALPIPTAPLTEDTAPAAIFAAHCEAVREAHAVLQTLDAPTLSAYADLPVWNVHRCLAALGLERARGLPSSATLKARGDKRSARMVAWLRKHDDYATLKQIQKGTGLSASHVRLCLSWSPSPFCRVPVQQHAHGVLYAYQLKTFKPEPMAEVCGT